MKKLIENLKKDHWHLAIPLALFTGFLMKLPLLLNFQPETYYQKYISIIYFFPLFVFMGLRNKLEKIYFLLPLLIFIGIFVHQYFNPGTEKNSTYILSLINFPLLSILLFGIGFLGKKALVSAERIEFLRFCGNAIVLGGLMEISTGIFTLLTIALYNLLGMNIAEFYMQNIGVWLFPAVPIISANLVLINPNLVNKISPLIAKIFTPLITISLLVFSSALMMTPKNIFEDREFLLIFNIILIVVLALIIFSLGEFSKEKINQFQWILLIVVSLNIVMIDLVSITALIYRIQTYGVSPNKMAVLGGNILMLGHLLMVLKSLLLIKKSSKGIEETERSIGFFLPIYAIWFAIIGFLFPIIFDFA